jgi:hypothetical protein
MLAIRNLHEAHKKFIATPTLQVTYFNFHYSAQIGKILDHWQRRSDSLYGRPSVPWGRPAEISIHGYFISGILLRLLLVYDTVFQKQIPPCITAISQADHGPLQTVISTQMAAFGVLRRGALYF